MADNYLIKESTLTALADAVRGANRFEATEGLIIDPSVISSEGFLIENAVSVTFKMISSTNEAMYTDDCGVYPAAYSYREDIDGDLVPVIYRHEGDPQDIQYIEPFYYMGADLGPDGEEYDWWIKDESENEDPGQYTQTSDEKMYILTNRVVQTVSEDNKLTLDQMIDEIQSNTEEYYSLYGTYVLKPSFSSLPQLSEPIVMTAKALFHPNREYALDTVEIDKITLENNTTFTIYGKNSTQNLEYIKTGGWRANVQASGPIGEFTYNDPTWHYSYQIIEFLEPQVVSKEAYAAFQQLIQTTIRNPLMQLTASAVTDYLEGKTSVAVITEDVRPYAFAECSSLSYVEFQKCSSIGQNAFTSCPSLKRIVFNSPSPITVGSAAFMRATSLEQINFKTSAPIMISSYGFSGCSMSYIMMDNGVYFQQIGERGFQACPNLSWAQIYANNVGSYAFYNCNKMSWCILCDCNIIEGSAFLNCSALSQVTLVGNQMVLFNALATSIFSNVSSNFKLRIPSGIAASVTAQSNFNLPSTSYTTY